VRYAPDFVIMRVDGFEFEEASQNLVGLDLPFSEYTREPFAPHLLSPKFGPLSRRAGRVRLFNGDHGRVFNVCGLAGPTGPRFGPVGPCEAETPKNATT
jgi:hypothetical protein